jgi:hypothetical protein
VTAAGPPRDRLPRGGRLLVALVSCLAAAPAAGAQATEASIHPSFTPNRLAAAAAFRFAFALTGGEGNVPPPVRRVLVRLPAGFALDLRRVATCASSRLRDGGPGACPARSLVGRGHALLEVHAGSQSIPEEAQLSAVRATDRGGHPTFAIYGQGQTPLQQHSISTATLSRDAPPYGSRLTVSVPPIPTLVLEPDASILSFALTIGGPTGGPGGRAGPTVTVPRRCPRGGFPFAAEFQFTDGSHAAAAAHVPCPGRR